MRPARFVRSCFYGRPNERRACPGGGRGRQDARLLERRREQACCRRPCRTAARSVFGRDQLLAGSGMAQGHRGSRRRRGTFADVGAVRGGSMHRRRIQCVGRPASFVEHAAMSTTAMGRLLAGRAVVRALQLDDFWADRLPASRKSLPRRSRAVQCSQLTLHLDSASSPARAAAYLSWLNVLA